MARGYTIDRRQVAFDRFEKFNKNNPTPPSRILSIREQKRKAALTIEIDKQKKLRKEIDKENEERFIQDCPHFNMPVRTVGGKKK
jgi:hypothetical protein